MDPHETHKTMLVETEVVETGSSEQTGSVAEQGEQIYRALYRDKYEKKYSGRYVVIEVQTKLAYVAASPAGAMHKAESEDPDGLFHLIKIQGAPKGIKSYLMKLVALAHGLAGLR